MHADGFRVRAWVYINGASQYPGNWDDNGANPGCFNDYWAGSYLDAQKICVEIIGCSGWLNH